MKKILKVVTYAIISLFIGICASSALNMHLPSDYEPIDIFMVIWFTLIIFVPLIVCGFFDENMPIVSYSNVCDE